MVDTGEAQDPQDSPRSHFINAFSSFNPELPRTVIRFGVGQRQLKSFALYRDLVSQSAKERISLISLPTCDLLPPSKMNCVALLPQNRGCIAESVLFLGIHDAAGD